MTWMQNYIPVGNIWLSALIAAIPIIFFFLALTLLRMKGHVAGTITVILSFLIAVFVYGMPIGPAVSSAIYGFFYGLWPIAWIIVGAVFLYKISVVTGDFNIVRHSILGITEDQRLQLILVGFAFGAFLEGAAGFGAPVAITAALLAGLGFRPLYAAGLCLIANTAPVAFGAMGIPIIVAGQVSNLDPFLLSQMAGRQLPFLSVFVPFLLVIIMDGWRGVRETWPAVLVGGGTFAIVQFLTSNYFGPELPDITAAIATLVVLPLFLRFWQPKRIFRFDESEAAPKEDVPHYSMGEIIKAWSPFIILTIFVMVWSIAPFKKLFAKGGALESWVLSFDVSFLNNIIVKTAPIVATDAKISAVYKFDWFSATGTAIILAAIVSTFVLKMRPARAIGVFGMTLKELALPIYSIGIVLAFAFIANYSGLSSTLALALSHTGKSFTFFSPFLGWLGVFVTGSDTSSNALFGALQATTAHQIGVSDVLLVAVNSTGGVTGKMISPQSIAIACAAVGLVGKESDLFRYTVKYSLGLCAVAGIMTTLQGYVLPWMIP
ncbi:lactate permease LctP family transporter [Bartonella sp. M0177]|uniref:lactate permease LctP family transporter n=3 Tax=Bartonellaceae TaxID=772 RepID=UPI0018DD1404|nr:MULTISPECIES: lactate permease LctP family transporter [Bartonella]MBH9993745.1 lactate permease LctP family transporter [Bartonella sp. P0291]MBH9997909.1 lactate permease LctP family transporter [Bartonella sp. M0192]MBI0000068.1 lactate permease LctP family transporter [Bartonella sp. M0191]MBI0004187.1 lactate permease LctP family transporter [Bartonella sp. M0177]MBI0007631.1 lactate permease LctP family transporter [Bartonella sp. M0193]